MPLLGTQQITTALTNQVVATKEGLTASDRVSLIAKFTYGGGTTVTAKAYIQTSLDGGTAWYDVASFAFTSASADKHLSVDATAAVKAAATPTTGTLADDTAIDGLLGDRIRMVVTTTGTYSGNTSLEVDYYAV